MPARLAQARHITLPNRGVELHSIYFVHMVLIRRGKLRSRPDFSLPQWSDAVVAPTRRSVACAPAVPARSLADCSGCPCARRVGLSTRRSQLRKPAHSRAVPLLIGERMAISTRPGRRLPPGQSALCCLMAAHQPRPSVRHQMPVRLRLASAWHLRGTGTLTKWCAR